MARAIAMGLDHPKVTAITITAFTTHIVSSVTGTRNTWEVGTPVLGLGQSVAM